MRANRQGSICRNPSRGARDAWGGLETTLPWQPLTELHHADVEKYVGEGDIYLATLRSRNEALPYRDDWLRLNKTPLESRVIPVTLPSHNLDPDHFFAIAPLATVASVNRVE